MVLRKYLLRRTIMVIPQVFGVILICFILVHLAPGDPSAIMGGEFAPPEYKEALRKRLGLDKSLPEQFTLYIGSILKGDLGYSWVFNIPVLDLIMERTIATVLLIGTSMVLSLILGTVMGIIAGQRPYSLSDNLISIISVLGYSIPNFWLGIMLMLFFSLNLGWLPVQGIRTLGVEMTYLEGSIDFLKHLLLPMVVLSTSSLALYARLMRTSMVETLSQDYIVTAKAKGCRRRAVVYRHALKNSLLPTVTVFGLNIGFILTGAVLTETVFAWPGIGRLMYDAIYIRDYPVLMGIFIIVSFIVIFSNLLIDLVYAYLDPRIRYK